MFLCDWFYGILTSLGLWQKEAKILFLGLDIAGKTELLQKLKEISSTPPTQYPRSEAVELRFGWWNTVGRTLRQTQYSTSEELSIGKINFKVFDLGSHQHALRVLRDYDAKVDAVVYLVEPYDMWFAESKRELDALLSDESLANIPFLILTSGKYPFSDKMLLYHLGLTNLTTGKGKVNLGNTNVRPLEVFNNFEKDYSEGFEWLSQYIK